MPRFGSVGNFVVVTRFCRSEINTLSDAIVDAENGASNMPQRRKHNLQICRSAKANRNGAGVGKSTDFFASVASFTYVKEATPTIMQRTPLLRRKALIWVILMGHRGTPEIET